MPSIKTEGIFPNDSIHLTALMLWPKEDESDMRRFYYAADYANGFVYDHEPSSIYPWQANLIQALLEAPSWQDIKKESTIRTKKAVIAGMVFTFMFMMDKCKEKLPRRGDHGASLSKAFYLVEEWSRDGATYGDGTPFPLSDKTIKDCWRDYRSVAHLWAALEMNRIVRYAPDLKIMRPENFHKFMSTVAYLQMFGTTFHLNNKSKRMSGTLLPPTSTWLVNTDTFTPRILLPRDDSAYDDAPFLKFLQRYDSTARL